MHFPNYNFDNKSSCILGAPCRISDCHSGDDRQSTDCPNLELLFDSNVGRSPNRFVRTEPVQRERSDSPNDEVQKCSQKGPQRVNLNTEKCIKKSQDFKLDLLSSLASLPTRK